MEYSSHSLPTKTYRSNVVAGKTPYDDVFKARPNFKVPTLSPRDEDYEEIFQVFHSSRGGSSIPLLDLPAGGCEASDVLSGGRSSCFEYSDVFGSFNGSDFAICYDEMFIQPKAVDDSTDESWTPAQSESLSDESDPWSEKNQNLSGGDIHHSYHHKKQFNISYNKANPESKEYMINGMTHVTQLDAIPGYSFIMNETSSLQYAEDESAHLRIEENIDLGAVVAEGNRLKTTVSQPSVNGFGLQCYETEPNHLAGYDNSNSPGKTSILESDVNLRTRTSHLPPPSYSKLNSKLKACNSHVLERREADYSPPHFDVEIDASSTAAASSACMEDAVERAQAECDGAKDMMERKEDVDNCTKSHWENDICQGENNISSKGGRFPLRYERECSRMKAYAEEQSKQVRHTIDVDSGAIDGKDNIHAEQGKEHTQSHVRYKSDGTVAWREATCYYELVEESNNGEANTSGTGAFVEQQDYHMRTKAATKDHECQEIGKCKVLKGGCEQVAWRDGKEGQGSVRQEEHTENSDRAQKVGEWLGKDNKNRLTSPPGETDNKPREVDKFISNDIQTEDHSEEYEVITKQKPKEVSERTEYVIKKKESIKREDIGMERKSSLDANEYEIELISGQVEDGGKLKETVGKSSVEKLNKEICLVCARQVGENKHEKTCEMGQDKKKRVEAAESEGNTKRSNEVFEQEVNKNIIRVDLKQQKSKKEQNCDGKEEKKEKSSKMTTVQWQNAERKKGASEERRNDDFEPDENEKRLIEAWEKKEKWKRLRAAREREKSEKEVKLLFKEDSIENSSSKVDVLTDFKKNIDKERNGEGFNGQNSVHEQLKKVVSNTELNMDQGNGTIREDQKKSDEVNVSSKAHTLAARVTVCDNINGNRETHEPSVCEEYKSLRMEHKTHEREVEVNNDPLKDETTSSDKNQSTFQHKGINDENKAESLCRIGVVDRSDDNDIDLKGIHFNKGKENSEIASDTENAHLLTPKQIEERFGFYQEEKRDIITASQVVQESVNNESNLEDVLPAHRFRSQTPELQETKFRKKIIIEEREEEERLKRERDLENDVLRTIEEENEREREREKDRMAVDTATREACERAFTEARERAERAAMERETAEVRQRALAEARERLLKASAEARERLFADKPVDARLKADRNAVERAMAEARQRAFEKAKAEKASHETSEVKIPVTDNYSSYSRNGGIRISSNDLQNLQHQSMGPRCDSIYSHSSVVSGLESESAQRCKARLERHQRTAERAAKALAEKNKRDLLAHKEQTERNRLAEFLDADVKRWSSGKEGNLRALLSTLQYILGTDSGWQPIPLTEVITSAAVKKAYRKATLCVHPDKLQQRGASIHQKYICEKVFDLLKEAWNKFNSEER